MGRLGLGYWSMVASIFVPLILCVFFAISFYDQVSMPTRVYIATAGPHSFYYDFAQDLRRPLDSRDWTVFGLTSDGSVRNAELLRVCTPAPDLIFAKRPS